MIPVDLEQDRLRDSSTTRGKHFWHPARVPLRLRVQVRTLPRRGDFRQGHAAQADLLRFQNVREGLPAGGHHPLLDGPDQRPRAFGRPRACRVHLRARHRKPQLLVARDEGRVGEEHGRRVPGALPEQEVRSRPRKKRVFEPRTLPDRHSLQPAHRKVLYEAGVGGRPLALGRQSAEEGPQPHHRFLAQSPGW